MLEQHVVLETTCWSGGFTAELCCDLHYGSRGRDGCFDDVFNYELCCGSSTVRPQITAFRMPLKCRWNDFTIDSCCDPRHGSQGLDECWDNTLSYDICCKWALVENVRRDPGILPTNNVSGRVASTEILPEAICWPSHKLSVFCCDLSFLHKGREQCWDTVLNRVANNWWNRKVMAQMLATSLGEALGEHDGQPLLFDNDEHLVLSGSRSVRFALSRDRMLKVHVGMADEEMTIGLNIPTTDTLLPVLNGTFLCKFGVCYTGIIVPLLPGDDLTKYGTILPLPSPSDLVRIAADLSVALYVLHTKISGYTILHCDLKKGNVVLQRLGNAVHNAVLLDFGGSLVRARAGTSVLSKVFPLARGTCHEGFNGSLPRVPYNALIEWRSLADLLFHISEGTDASDADRLNFQRVAPETILSSRRLEILRPFLELLLAYTKIKKETDVLAHPIFDGLLPSPRERAAAVAEVQPSSRFKHLFR